MNLYVNISLLNSFLRFDYNRPLMIAYFLEKKPTIRLFRLSVDSVVS